MACQTTLPALSGDKTKARHSAEYRDVLRLPRVGLHTTPLHWGRQGRATDTTPY